jgi:hypothetical protein
MGGNAAISPFNGSRNGILDTLRNRSRNGNLDCDFRLPTQELGSYDGFDGDGSSSLPKSTPTSVRVEYVDELTTPAELRKRFQGYGQILKIGIAEAWGIDGRRPVTATITFADEKSATTAARALNAGYLRSDTIRVQVVE